MAATEHFIVFLIPSSWTSYTSSNTRRNLLPAPYEISPRVRLLRRLPTSNSFRGPRAKAEPLAASALDVPTMPMVGRKTLPP
mmetsp:Transcript_35563/g.84886  ORF Transcript_35563/g.84886 Transcript_35563/m.84886 type:complete len:82 (-) Transcript_35563:16-261(-)